MMKEEKALRAGPSKIEIVYQRMGSPRDPAVFLIMGSGGQLIAWPDGFCAELVRRAEAAVS